MLRGGLVIQALGFGLLPLVSEPWHAYALLAFDALDPERIVVRLGPPPVAPDASQRLYCTCAPVWDYTGQEVSRVGLFGHGADDRPILTDLHRGVWDLARRISMRLGYLPPALEGTA